jgi:hypothetical protein
VKVDDTPRRSLRTFQLGARRSHPSRIGALCASSGRITRDSENARPEADFPFLILPTSENAVSGWRSELGRVNVSRIIETCAAKLAAASIMGRQTKLDWLGPRASGEGAARG